MRQSHIYMWASRRASAGCSCSGRAGAWPELMPARHACFAPTPLQATRAPWHCARRHTTGRLAVQCVQAAERPAAEAPAPNQALSHAPATARGPATSLAGPPTWMMGLELPRYDRSLGSVELVVAGAGPSGLAVADRVSQAGALSSAPLKLGKPGPSAGWVAFVTCAEAQGPRPRRRRLHVLPPGGSQLRLQTMPSQRLWYFAVCCLVRQSQGQEGSVVLGAAGWLHLVVRRGVASAPRVLAHCLQARTVAVHHLFQVCNQ